MGALLIDEDSIAQYKITEPACKIGSAPTCDIVLNAEGVSPVHVRIEKQGDDYFAAFMPGAALTRKVDFFTTIPTATLNRKPLPAKLTKMSAGDKLQVGSRLLVLHIV